MSIAASRAISGSSRRKVSRTSSRVGAPGASSSEHRTCVGAKVRSCSTTRGDHVRQERDPVPVLLVHSVPEGPESRPPREVGQKRRLAVASFSDDKDHAAVSLDVQPIEQAMARQRLVVKRRALDFAKLDRISTHAVTRYSSDEPWRRDRRSSRIACSRHAEPRGGLASAADRLVGRRERYGPPARGVNQGIRFGPGHGPHSAPRGSPAD